MKQLAKIILLVVVLTMSFVFATACQIQENHVHTPAEAWKTDATGHYHECTSEDCTEKLDYATHSGGTATCTAKAVCSVCGAEYGELLDHTWSTEIVVDVEPTWDTDGSGHYVCTECGAIGETESIPKDSSTWHLVYPEGEKDCFVLDEEGNLTATNTATSTSDLWLNMFAINDQTVDGTYMVEANFDPTKTEANEKGAERTYGIVAWYVDSDNFLIYWMQQKAGGDWSGQFYGKVAGATRVFAAGEAWSGSEWDDMWWDSNAVNAGVRGTRFAVIEKAMGLRVVSKLETIKIDGVDTLVRKFELHNVYNGQDHIARTYYIKGCVEVEQIAHVRTGVYSNKIDVAVSGFAIQKGLWSVIADETNKDLYTFDPITGEVSGINCIADDSGNQHCNMYAVYGVPVGANYTVQATFDPTQTDANEKGSERTYGILAYYKDADNWLIYWMQQKPGGDWSAQLYGKIGGEWRNFTEATTADGWNNGEWATERWWDFGNSNTQLNVNTHPLLSTKVTVKIVSTVQEITVGGEQVTVRAFEIHQIVGNEDKVVTTYYVKDAVSVEGVSVGVYAKNFDLVISDFRLY